MIGSVSIGLLAGAVGGVVLLTRPARRRRRAVDAALLAASACASADPNDLDARVRLVEVHLALTGNFAVAHALLEAVLAKDPLHWAHGSRPTRLLAADALDRLGRSDAARAALARFVADYPEYRSRSPRDAEQSWRLETSKTEAEDRLARLAASARVAAADDRADAAGG